METQAHLIVDLGRLDDGKYESLSGELDQAVLEIDDFEQLHPAGPLKYALKAELLPGDEMLIRGTLTLPCHCMCSRCGKQFDTQFSEYDYCETFEVAGKTFLDLTESVRECIILALPSYPVCKEDCKGLCLRCGQDLNAGPCQCDEHAKTSCWDALDGLKPEA